MSKEKFTEELDEAIWKEIIKHTQSNEKYKVHTDSDYEKGTIRIKVSSK